MQDYKSIHNDITEAISAFQGNNRHIGRAMYKEYCDTCFAVFNIFDIIGEHYTTLKTTPELKDTRDFIKNRLNEFIAFYEKGGCECTTGQNPLVREPNCNGDGTIEYNLWYSQLYLHYDYLIMDPVGLATMSLDTALKMENDTYMALKEAEKNMRDFVAKQESHETAIYPNDPERYNDYITNEIFYEDLVEQESIITGRNPYFRHHPALLDLIRKGYKPIHDTSSYDVYHPEYRICYRLSKMNFLVKKYDTRHSINYPNTNPEKQTIVEVSRDIPALIDEIKTYIEYFDQDTN
jgi:hypothetical protein